MQVLQARLVIDTRLAALEQNLELFDPVDVNRSSGVLTVAVVDGVVAYHESVDHGGVHEHGLAITG